MATLPGVGRHEVGAAEGVEDDVQAIATQRAQGGVELLPKGLPSAPPDNDLGARFNTNFCRV